MRSEFSLKLGLSIFALALGLACATVPYTDRQQLMLVSWDQEVQLGRDAFVEVMKTTETSSDLRSEVLDRVAKRIVRTLPKKFRKLDWKWTLFSGETVNAFAVPGGRIGVYEGILPVAATEAGLAAIVGHEAAHVSSRHGAERLSGGLLLGTALNAATLSVADVQYGAEIVAALGIGLQVGVVLPFSRKHELESDYVGAIYMAKAGYDPHVAPRVWERMRKRFGDTGVLTFLSTHPSSAKREQLLEEALPEAMKHYNKAKVQYGRGEVIERARPGESEPSAPAEQEEPAGGVKGPRSL